MWWIIGIIIVLVFIVYILIFSKEHEISNNNNNLLDILDNKEDEFINDIKRLLSSGFNIKNNSNEFIKFIYKFLTKRLESYILNQNHNNNVKSKEELSLITIGCIIAILLINDIYGNELAIKYCKKLVANFKNGILTVDDLKIIVGNTLSLEKDSSPTRKKEICSLICKHIDEGL
ncbi:hypothetical protein CSPB12327_03530 [Campylobacter sp. RM12327]|uniref:hypothetical protein n=1 Tax=Campylobacter sputorum TaxID=206 RepID=UPI000B772CB0|nr:MULTISPECIES: hypothetical protein [Campylobacter]ASM39833.1 hypothetical protein CSPB_0599 [Campylobacter sputorum]MBE7357483.1 hypothetical protein [Campylobacter sp. RM11302]MBF6669217.1 hypothetical protein [Campylobacter sp. RM12327]MBF6674308.1 hypothetical protein [Campylobacter sp. RM13538]MBF6675349.1 hypothetical protein [Campylobacter sp. RM12321]